jgi:hypothetical protein
MVERNQKEQMKSKHGTGRDTGCCGAAPLLGIIFSPPNLECVELRPQANE